MEPRTLLTTILIAVWAVEITESGMAPTRPIYEPTGEILPLLGNPLGGGSPEIVKRNTIEHVNNQRRIFNREMSERMKAQRLQMRSLEPQDSYLKAYHEQHEQFHMDLEKKMLEQMGKSGRKSKTMNDTKVDNLNTKKEKTTLNFNDINVKGDNKVDSVVESVRNKRLDREHDERRTASRSVQYAPGHFLPMKQPQIHASVKDPRGQPSAKIIYYSPVEKFNAADVSALTSTSLQGANHNYYSQLAAYGKLDSDVESSLTALIGKQPDDQLKGLTYLLQQSSANHKVTGEDLKNSHINLKASSIDAPEEYYKDHEYQAAYSTPLNSYQKYIFNQDSHSHVRDHTPIIENVDDVADPIKPPTRYTPLPTVYTYVPDVPATSTLSSNYYKVEVANQVHNHGTKSAASSYVPTTSYSYTSGHDNLHYASQYEFGYRVRDPHTGNDFGHSEISNGHFATGSYHVLLPDGRLQKVRYHAGPGGYKADVSYD